MDTFNIHEHYDGQSLTKSVISILIKETSLIVGELRVRFSRSLSVNVMEVSCTDEKWRQLIELVDDGIRGIALSADVSHEDLRYRYVMRCLHVTKPLECFDNALTTKQR
ncbi:unnamed protein product, partial [Litomosoides sigmodontis]